MGSGAVVIHTICHVPDHMRVQLILAIKKGSDLTSNQVSLCNLTLNLLA